MPLNRIQYNNYSRNADLLDHTTVDKNGVLACIFLATAAGGQLEPFVGLNYVAMVKSAVV